MDGSSGGVKYRAHAVLIIQTNLLVQTAEVLKASGLFVVEEDKV